MNTIQKLDAILNSPRLRVNSKSFVESMLEQAKKKDLSAKQLEYVDKFWAECFPAQEILDEENEWANSFSDEMRKNVQIMGEYYERHYPTSRLAKNYKEAGWVPSREIYNKSVDSDWGKRVIRNYNTDFRFKVGDLCVLRDTARNRSYYKDTVGNPMLVLECIKNSSKEFVNHYILIDTTKMEEQKQFTLAESAINVLKTKKVK